MRSYAFVSYGSSSPLSMILTFDIYNKYGLETKSILYIEHIFLTIVVFNIWNPQFADKWISMSLELKLKV